MGVSFTELFILAATPFLFRKSSAPGIALLEAAFAGARPVVTKFGGTIEYYGFDAEYFDPRRRSEILRAIKNGVIRGRLSTEQAKSYSRYTWEYCARLTLEAYRLRRD